MDMVVHNNFSWGFGIHSCREIDSIVAGMKKMSWYNPSLAETLKNYRTVYCYYLIIILSD